MSRPSPRAASPLRLPRGQRHDHRGAAVLEFAVCLPLLMLLVFGVIEATGFIFLKQTLNVAAYEAAREAVQHRGTNELAFQRATAILTSRNIHGAEVLIQPANFESINRGDSVMVQVAAPTGPNSTLAGQFLNNRGLTVQVIMVKE